MKKKQVTFYYPTDKLLLFEDRFPSLRVLFLQKCLDLAIKDKSFLDKVIFNDCII